MVNEIDEDGNGEISDKGVGHLSFGLPYVIREKEARKPAEHLAKMPRNVRK